jgi:hypothetical protein
VLQFSPSPKIAFNPLLSDTNLPLLPQQTFIDRITLFCGASALPIPLHLHDGHWLQLACGPPSTRLEVEFAWPEEEDAKGANEWERGRCVVVVERGDGSDGEWITVEDFRTCVVIVG